MSNHFQTIVIGAGSLGSATAYWLTQAGQRDVLLLEQHQLAHAHGSHGDHSRIIRHSYHDEKYGRLTRAMYEAWDHLEHESGQQVLVRTGGLDIADVGSTGANSVAAYRRVMTAVGIPHEQLSKAQLLERYPQWQFEQDVTATFQAEAGLVDIRRAVLTHANLARAAGATVLDHTAVVAVEGGRDGGDGVRVVTAGGVHTADAVVVCAGSWTDALLAPLGQTWRTTITEEQVLYVQSRRLQDFTVGTFPVWAYHGSDLVYGFPAYGEPAVKLARENLSRVVTQEQRSAEPHLEENELLLHFLAEKLPGAHGPVLYARTCPYDLTPDRDFVLDALPGHPRVFVGAGAAHAGKYAALIGQVLAELVTTGRSQHPIADFAADRPALTDPSFTPIFSLQR